MKTKLMAMMLVAGGALLAQPRFSIGVRVGAPAPVTVAAYQPPCPGPGYVWIDGYYDEFGNWFDGYWALPPYEGSYWVAPRFYSGHYYAGYWNGGRGIYRGESRRFAAPVYARGAEGRFDGRAAFTRGFESRGGGHDRGPGPGRGAEGRHGGRR